MRQASPAFGSTFDRGADIAHRLEIKLFRFDDDIVNLLAKADTIRDVDKR